MSCSKIELSQRSIRKLIGKLLNIIGIRNKGTNPTEFDDQLKVFWKTDQNKWAGVEYAITTDPSTNYLESGGIGTFKGVKATAILPHGQYVDMYKLGKHNGKYDALVQDKPFCVYRDYDRNAYLNFNVDDLHCGSDWGINIHRAKSGKADNGKGDTSKIGPYSAGCQVFQNYYCFTDDFIPRVKKQQKLYGNKYFTYTLIDKWLENQFYLKRGILIGSLFIGSALILYGIKLSINNK